MSSFRLDGSWCRMSEINGYDINGEIKRGYPKSLKLLKIQMGTLGTIRTERSGLEHGTVR